MDSEGAGWDVSVLKFALSLSHLSIESSLNESLQHDPQHPLSLLPPLPPYEPMLHQLDNAENPHRQQIPQHAAPASSPPFIMAVYRLAGLSV